MFPTIDVVIPTRDRWDLTERCLCRLRKQTGTHQVIVVDNASIDGTPDKIRESFPEVRLVETGGNLGFSSTCNLGVAAGNGDVIVLLNNDVECRPDFLELLMRPLQDDERVGTVAALLVESGEKMIDSVGLAADPTLASFPRLRGRPVAEAGATRPVLAGPVGAAGAYRRVAWIAVDGLDEHMTFYGEDLDLALRLRSAGWRAAVAPDAIAVHVGSATAGRRSEGQRFQSGFARAYLLRRNDILRSRLAARALLTEALVIFGDTLLARDLSALRGRVAGWSEGKHIPKTPYPPADAVDATIGFVESMRLRHRIYTA
jgi:GT2 family glycosyltransferase